MRRITAVVLLLMGSMLWVHSPARAAEEKASGFFGFKKFIKKTAPADASKKKAAKAAGDELTEDEKKQVKEMASKVPSKGALSKGRVKVPARFLLAPAPKNPSVVARNAPLLSAPKNPNAVVIHPPKPPGRIPQVPVTTGPEAPNKKT